MGNRLDGIQNWDMLLYWNIPSFWKWLDCCQKCAEVLKIENKLLEITLSDGHVSDMDNLSKELLGASSSYHEILNVHSVDLCIDSEFMYKF